MLKTEDIYSVSDLTRIIRRLLEDGVPQVWVEGEISNLTLHRSGHRYFTLKDSNAQIASVMWKTRPLGGVTLSDGMRVRCLGKLTVWEQGGRYQLDVALLTPAGVGDLHASLELLKQKLTAEGLFDQSRKRKLPRFPNAIGIVTSKDGAAIRDLAWGFATRWPPTAIYLIPVAVQGAGSAAQIASAINRFNEIGLVDLIIIGRGGGSLEDLWSFNAEVVVRAVANSTVPVVSAVGHEVDVTLSDLSADLRAPTPTGASALVVPDRIEMLGQLKQIGKGIRLALEQTIRHRRERLHSYAKSYSIRRIPTIISEKRQQLDRMDERLLSGLDRKLSKLRLSLTGINDRLYALSPQAVLERGYSVTTRRNGDIVTDSSDLLPGELLKLRFARGTADTTVEEICEHTP